MDEKKIRFFKIKNYIRQHKKTGYKALAVILFIVTILAEINPEVQNYLAKTNILLLLILLLLLDIAVFINETYINRSSQISKNQDMSRDILISNISKTSEMNFLEFAGATTLPIIRHASNQNIVIKILVKHPDTVEGLQRERSYSTLDTLFNSVFEEYSNNVEIKCYKLPYTLRGRYIREKMIEVGWLTPNIKAKTAHGSINPSLIIQSNDEHFSQVSAFFERTFNEYWNHADTVDAKQILDSYTKSP